jgi:hypothetical protein
MIESELAGAELAAALAGAVAGIEPLELSEASRGQLVEMALAAERVKAWAVAVQAAATVALVEQFETAHEGSVLGTGRSPTSGPWRPARCRCRWPWGSRCGPRTTSSSWPWAWTSTPHWRRPWPSAGSMRPRPGSSTTTPPGYLRRKPPACSPAWVTDPDDGPTAAAGLVKELRDGVRTLWSIPAHQLRPILTKAVADLAPESIEGAAEVAERGRHVAHYASAPLRPGALVLHGPDHLLAAMYTHLDATARAARTARAPQTLDQLRFDVAVGHLTGGAYGLNITTNGANPPRPHRTTLINLTAAETTILGLDNQPATLHTPTGDVPTPAQLARALAHDRDQATWRAIRCDPATGTATATAPTYRPTTRITEYCRVRDGHTSRFPTSAARTIELDHIKAFNHHAPTTGGATTPANLAATGKRDHQAKTDRIIHVTGDANGTLTYSTGTGHTYTSQPHQYLDPQPPAQPPPAPSPEPPPNNGDPPF